jgi:hypothetical protein
MGLATQGPLLEPGRLVAETVVKASLDEAEAAIDGFAQRVGAGRVLLAVDVDLTLLQPDHPCASFPNLARHHGVMAKAVGDLSPEERDLMLNLAVRKLPARLVEESAPIRVRALQRKGMKVIACSGALAAPLASGKPGLDWRREQLAGFGFDFAGAFPSLQAEVLPGTASHAGGRPGFRKGILLTNGEHGKETKGTALVAFLETCGFRPAGVALLDDRRRNHEEVEAALKAYDPAIAFLGVEYTAGLTQELGEVSAEEMGRFWKELAEQARSATRTLPHCPLPARDVSLGLCRRP